MTSDTRPVSEPARVAEPGEAISYEELLLATRNHGMPLEALRHDITPVGLHYLLVHYDIPYVEPVGWRLAVGGRVARPLSLDLEALRARPRVSLTVTFECAGNGRARLAPRPVSQPWVDEAVGTAVWTGTPLAGLLREARPDDHAVEVLFTGADHGIERGEEQDYARSMSLQEAMRDEVLLAYEMNGAPLPPQHGFPLRLVVPGWYGMAQVKWLHEITLLEAPYEGFQQLTAYRLKQRPEETGDPVTRMRPRALVTPPGFPDFMSRTRFVDPGEHLLSGRAWSGNPPVTRVEVSTDDGRTWADAELGPAPGRWAWRSWTYRWHADAPARYQLRALAHDVTGAAQPVDQPWNRQGMANNTAQRVTVVVRER
ncbi:MAG: sulfite oxidase [Streptomycetales bacterium]